MKSSVVYISGIFGIHYAYQPGTLTFALNILLNIRSWTRLTNTVAKRITAVSGKIRHNFGIIHQTYTEDPIEFFLKLVQSYSGLLDKTELTW